MLKRDSHTANDRVNIFPLELCPAKSVYQELDLLCNTSREIEAWGVYLTTA